MGRICEGVNGLQCKQTRTVNKQLGIFSRPRLSPPWKNTVQSDPKNHQKTFLSGSLVGYFKIIHLSEGNNDTLY